MRTARAGGLEVERMGPAKLAIIGYEVRGLNGAGVPSWGHPGGHSRKPEPRRIESKLALGKTIDRLSAGEEIKLISSFP